MPAKLKHLTPFGYNVRIQLMKRQMTQVELAAALGVHPQAVSSCLRARHPMLRTVESYAKVLGCAPGKLDPNYGKRKARKLRTPEEEGP